MKKEWLVKTLAMGIIVLFIGAIVTPSIGGNFVNKNEIFSKSLVSSSEIDWWSMFHHDLYHSGYSTSTGPGTNTTSWVYTTGANVWSSPAVCDGKIYVGSWDGRVYCFGSPPSAPIIDGPTKGFPFISYLFTFTSTDPDGDDVSYYIDWGDGYITNWTSYQPSSSSDYSEGHSWIGFDKFTIRAKAKDNFGSESPWTNYSFSTPRNRVSYSSFFMRFLELFPNAFPILRYFVRGM